MSKQLLTAAQVQHLRITLAQLREGATMVYVNHSALSRLLHDFDALNLECARGVTHSILEALWGATQVQYRDGTKVRVQVGQLTAVLDAYDAAMYPMPEVQDG